MFRWAPLVIRLPLVLLGIAVNTVVLCFAVYFFAIFKLLIPVDGIRLRISMILAFIGEIWAKINEFLWTNFFNVEWDIQIAEGIDPKKTYCVVVNHRSWVDIIILQTMLTWKVPAMRFFIKKQLIWVPLLGLAWWALDYPFMKRYSAAYLQKHPEKRGKDIEAARKSCEKFRALPTSILIFAEGTRITPAKYEKTNKEFKNLLPPKTGGFYTILGAMGDQIESVLDITIVYHGDEVSMMDLLFDRIRKITFVVQQKPLNDELREAQNYPAAKKWIKQLWVEKDQLISDIKSSQGNPIS